MKVLLKKEVCGLRELCTGPIGYSKMRFSKKKKNADARMWTQSKCILSVCLVKIKKSTYFCYYLWVLLHFLVLFIGSTVLFQLTFTFIYSTFSKKFSVSTK